MKYIRTRFFLFLCGISLFSFVKAYTINPLIRAAVSYGIIYSAIEFDADYKMQSFKHPLACVAATVFVIAVPIAKIPMTIVAIPFGGDLMGPVWATGSAGKIIVGAVGAGLTARAIRSANSNSLNQKPLGDEVVHFCGALAHASSNTSTIESKFYNLFTQESRRNVTRLLEGIAVGATLVAMTT